MTGAAFETVLLPGERILWSGRPAGGILTSPRDLLLVPFTLLWLSFAVTWEIAALRLARAGPAFPAFGAVFVLVGLFMVAGRFLLDAGVRRRTRYAVTDRRILIWRPLGGLTVLARDRLVEVHLNLRRGGRGDLRFGPQTPLFGLAADGVGLWTPALGAVPRFIAIEEPRRVFALVQGADPPQASRALGAAPARPVGA